jgi:hypothetical protein
MDVFFSLIQTRIPGSARRAAGRRVRKGNEVYCPRIFFQPRQERSLAKRIENEGKSRMNAKSGRMKGV